MCSPAQHGKSLPRRFFLQLSLPPLKLRQDGLSSKRSKLLAGLKHTRNPPIDPLRNPDRGGPYA